MTYPDETMKAAREVVKKWTYEGCLDQHIAAEIQAAEVRGYDKAVEDAAKIASYGVVPECCNNPSFHYDDWGNAIGGGECCGEPDYRRMTLAEVSLEISTLKKGDE
jgi:hypothetical protein